MFVDLDWPLNASSLLSASAELLVWQWHWHLWICCCELTQTVVGKEAVNGRKLQQLFPDDPVHCVHIPALCLTQKAELFVCSHDQMLASIWHGNGHFHKIGWKLVLFQMKWHILRCSRTSALPVLIVPVPISTGWLHASTDTGQSIPDAIVCSLNTTEGPCERTEHIDIFLFFRPSLNGVIFPMFRLLVEGGSVRF